MPDPITPPSDGVWHYEYITPKLIQAERVDRVIYSGKTSFQSVTIQETSCFGRSLVLDNKTQSTELDEFVYHEGLIHPAFIAHKEPRDIFIAGGGEGAAIREIFSYNSVQHVVMVDIDAEVVELCREHLPNHHQGAFDDPRLQIHYEDAFEFLKRLDHSYDVAVIDVPDPLEGGPAYLLYTREFYETVLNRLRPGGLIVAQAGPTGPAFYQQCFAAVANTIGSVFDSISLYEVFVPSFGSTWGFVVGSLGPDPASLTAKHIDKHISARLNRTLGYYDGVTHQGMFSVPKYLRDALASEDRVISRDRPLFVS